MAQLNEGCMKIPSLSGFTQCSTFNCEASEGIRGNVDLGARRKKIRRDKGSLVGHWESNPDFSHHPALAALLQASVRHALRPSYIHCEVLNEIGDWGPAATLSNRGEMGGLS